MQHTVEMKTIIGRELLTALHVNFLPCIWHFVIFSFGGFFFPGLFTSSLLPYLTEISSFFFWWPSAWECWTKGMSAGCPPGVQACCEASGDYSPACLASCIRGWFWVPLTSVLRGVEKFTRIQGPLPVHSHVAKKKRSRSFCVVFFIMLAGF